MNYTENYHLPQWEETDRIMRTDFNQMCADIDAGIGEAQKTADAAAVKPYVIGTYTGSTSHSQEIKLGFRPKALLISVTYLGTDTIDNAVASFVFCTKESTGTPVIIHSDGFSVSSGNKFPNVNHPGWGYTYLAFL